MSSLITIHNDQKALPIDINAVRLITIEILLFLKINTDEFIIHFITEEKTKFLHSLFFNDSSTTDCMSFPIDGCEEKKDGIHHTFGECFINPKEALLYDRKTPYEELSRYIVHCILHCNGLDDQTDSEKAVMREQENKALQFAKDKKVLLTNPDPLYT